MNLGDKFVDWAKREASIVGLVLIGSRARSTGFVGAADAGSDWDFQVVTDNPYLFATPHWCSLAGIGEVITYVYRVGRLGHAPKVSAIVSDGEVDVVIIAKTKLYVALLLYKAHLLKLFDSVRRALMDLSRVLQGGFLILKGPLFIRSFYAEICRWEEARYLGDEAIAVLWKVFLCDYKAIVTKIRRGELCAAQRWIHNNLGETNFVLLHELRRRDGAVSFPDARRVEQIVHDEWRERISIECRLERRSLLKAAEKCFRTCQILIAELDVRVCDSDCIDIVSSAPEVDPQSKCVLVEEGALERYH